MQIVTAKHNFFPAIFFNFRQVLFIAIPGSISLLVADLDDLGPPIGEENSDPEHGPRRARHIVFNNFSCDVLCES